MRTLFNGKNKHYAHAKYKNVVHCVLSKRYTGGRFFVIMHFAVYIVGYDCFVEIGHTLVYWVD